MLETFVEPAPPFQWLPGAFFALHRRRQFRGESGYQPLTYQEMATYAMQVLKLEPTVHRLFYRTMEETDNAVMYDQAQKVNALYEKAKAERENARPGRPKPRSQG